jgi:hypothetical protein
LHKGFNDNFERKEEVEDLDRIKVNLKPMVLEEACEDSENQKRKVSVEKIRRLEGEMEQVRKNNQQAISAEGEDEEIQAVLEKSK